MTSSSTKLAKAVDKRDAEIQRLRAAIVHAKDDREQVLRNPQLPTSARIAIGRAAMALKAELEKQ